MCSAFSQTALGSNGSSSLKFTTALARLTPSSVNSGGEFVEGEKFAVVLGRPAEQAEEVDEGLGQEAGIAISGHADDRAVLALGELGAVGSDEEGKVRELRRLGTQVPRRSAGA